MAQLCRHLLNYLIEGTLRRPAGLLSSSRPAPVSSRCFTVVPSCRLLDSIFIGALKVSLGKLRFSRAVCI